MGIFQSSESTEFLEAEASAVDHSWHCSPEFNKVVKEFHDRYALCRLQQLRPAALMPVQYDTAFDRDC